MDQIEFLYLIIYCRVETLFGKLIDQISQYYPNQKEKKNDNHFFFVFFISNFLKGAHIWASRT